jgi:hypothetical protein
MVAIEANREMSRTEIAEYLRAFADELHPSDTVRSVEESDTAGEEDDHQRDEEHSGNETEDSSTSSILSSLGDDENRTDSPDQQQRKVTFMVGSESTTINPPDTITFEMKVNSESSLFGSETGKSTTFALHWDEEDVPEDEELSVR